jgi:hypothetical protein
MKPQISPWMTDKNLQESLAQLESRGYSGLEEATERYRRSAVGVEDVFTWDSWSVLDPDLLGGDRLIVLLTLLRTLAWDLNAARHLIVFNIDQLLELINAGLASRSFRQVVLGVRAVLERAAITEQHFGEIRVSF